MPRPSLEESPRLTLPVSERDHALGPEKAPLSLVEYGDFECPYCGRAYGTVRRLRRTLGRRLRYVFRHFPLTQLHPSALIAAQAAEAAGLQGKFWELHDLIFEDQAELSPEALGRWAESLKLDMDRFARDLEGEEVTERIRQDRSSGLRSGVNGTPTFYVGGVRYDGEPSYEALLEALKGSGG